MLPAGLEALVAPVDVDIAGRLPSRLQPDVLVVPVITNDEPLPVPLLAVEVLSPSTRRFDLGPKRRAYARHGIPAHVIVDPVVPSMLVLALRDRTYVETGRAAGASTVRLPAPFEVEVSAEQLVGLSRP